jgi:hypothetical protein
VFRGQLTKTSGQDDSDHRSEFHGEATSRRHESYTVTQVSHDVVTICPEADDNTSTTEGENPDGNLSLASRDCAGLPDLVDGGVRTDSVGNIVGAVDERGRGSSHDLEESVEEFGAVIEMFSTSVNLFNVAGNNRLLALGADNILIDTVENGKLESPPHESTSVPRGIRLGPNHGLVLVRVGGRFLSSLLSGNLLVVASGLKIFTKGSSTLSAALLKLLAGKMAFVEVADDALEVVGGGRDRTTAEEERAKEYVVSLELPILLDDNTVQPGDEEDGHEKTPGSTSGDDHTGDLLLSKVDLIRATLPDKKHDNK